MFAATHSKSRKAAADGTGTPVVTYVINKWTAKINENEIYNEKCLPRKERGRKSKGKKKEDGCSSYHL